jgi:predicted porin
MFNLGETCMKKSLIALAVLAAAGAASAQSSVTLFGIVDATLAYGKTSGGNHVT